MCVSVCVCVCVCVCVFVFVALAIQHAKRMRLITLSSVDCPSLPYFTRLSHKQRDFLKKVTKHKICAVIFCKTFIN